MPKDKTPPPTPEPDEAVKPQDEPGYRDAGQSQADETNSESGSDA